ncbi:hypothetical protein [Streptomyces sp. NPDC089795]|uniref:hypothetical protein n=1 Tax=Streptomyces sp. NPDC089795 TaxID=3155297 RepID=UPI0034331CC8
MTCAFPARRPRRLPTLRRRRHPRSVRGRAALVLGYEDAALPIAGMYADQAIALSNNRPSLGRLNAVFGKAHAAALRGDHTTARQLLAGGRRIFDRAGSHEQSSDYAVPHWRVNVSRSCSPPAWRRGHRRGRPGCRGRGAPASLPWVAIHLHMHRGRARRRRHRFPRFPQRGR